MSETAISRAIREAVNATGMAHVTRTQSGIVKVRGAMMHLAESGTPDLTGYMSDGSGRFVGLEVKRPGKKRNAAQLAWFERAERAHALCWVVTSPAEALEFIRSRYVRHH